jgi:hypothetical protein
MMAGADSENDEIERDAYNDLYTARRPKDVAAEQSNPASPGQISV